MSDPAVPAYRYWAFISYSHKDTELAKWLHRAIETYGIPAGLVKHRHTTPTGDPAPKRMHPIFRDLDELPASANLGQAIEGALEASRYLIVVCSPHAAQSRWVNREIETFVEMGRHDRILAFVVDGEPNSGGERECFPPALRRQEPLAADARPQGHGRSDARLKLLAGMLGVTFDALKQRETQRRIRRLEMAVAVTLALVLAFAGLAWVANRERSRAIVAEANAVAEAHTRATAEAKAVAQARIALSRQLAAQAQAVLEDYPQRSLLLAAEAVNLPLKAGEPRIPASENALRLSLSTTGERGFSGHTQPVSVVDMSPDSRWLVTGSEDHTALLWDMAAPDPSSAPFVLWGHREAITAVGFSPDSLRLVTASEDGTARLWDLTRPDPSEAPVILRGHGSEPVYDAAFSPDGHWVITGGQDGTACLWDLAAPDPASSPVVLRGHRGPIQALAVSADSRWLATGGGGDGDARVWDLASPDPNRSSVVLADHEGLVTDVTISPDGRWLAIASYSKCRLWHLGDQAAGSIVLSASDDDETGANRTHAVAFSSDNRWVATGNMDGFARLWDLTAPDPSAAPLAFHANDWGVTSVALTPDRRWLITAGADYSRGNLFLVGSAESAVQLWDLTALDPTAEPLVLHGHEYGIRSVATSSDGRWLVSASGDGTARLWNLAALPDLSADPSVLRGHGDRVTSLAFGSDDRWLVSGSADASVRLWNLHDLGAEPLVLRGDMDTLNAVLLSPDNRWLVARSANGLALLWNMAAADAPQGPFTLPGQPDKFQAAAITADSRLLATGSVSGTVGLWDLASPDPPRAPLAVHDLGTPIVDAVTSADGKWLVISGGDQLVRVWNLADPAAAPLLLQGHQELIRSVAISPDGRWVATSSDDETARLWDLASPDPSGTSLVLQEIPGPNEYLDFATFSPDGRWLVMGTAGHWPYGPRASPLYLWDLAAIAQSTGPIVLRGHDYYISDVAFTPDSRWLASGSKDTSARLWDLADPVTEPVILRGGASEITAVAVSPGNHWLATGGEDGTIRLWNLRPDELVELACRVAGRNLSREEWDQYLPEQAYRKTCGQWSLDEE